jgi:hypothetical protein
MAGLEPRGGWLRRWFRAASTPVTFRIAPAAAGALALVLFAAGGLVLHPLSGVRTTDAPKSDGIPIVLEFTQPAARSVTVMGSFNRWNPGADPMQKDPETGKWRIVLRLPPGSHDYVFWIDGRQPAADPNADLVREDDFGNRNSVLFVKGGHDRSI